MKNLACARQQRGAVSALCQRQTSGLTATQQRRRLRQRRLTWQPKTGQIFVAGFDHIGILQCGQHVLAVSRQVGHHRRSQIGVNHHRATRLPLARQPRQVGLRIVGGQSQRASTNQRQGAGLGARRGQGGCGRRTVCHTFPVKGIVRVPFRVDTHHCQRGHLVNGLRCAKMNAVIHQRLGQLTTKPVLRQGVEVQRGNFLAR